MSYSFVTLAETQTSGHADFLPCFLCRVAYVLIVFLCFPVILCQNCCILGTLSSLVFTLQNILVEL